MQGNDVHVSVSANGAGTAPGNLPWQAEAKQLLDTALEKLPFLSQISASRELQMKVETHARQRGLKEITGEVAAEVLSSAGE
jgi:hypothetical protein